MFLCDFIMEDIMPEQSISHHLHSLFNLIFWLLLEILQMNSCTAFEGGWKSLTFSSFQCCTWEQSLNIKKLSWVFTSHLNFLIIQQRKSIRRDLMSRKGWIITCLSTAISQIQYGDLHIFLNKAEAGWNFNFHNEYLRYESNKGLLN